MKIGLPKALLYYRYGHLWKTFFRELGCDVLVSEETCKETVQTGCKDSMDETCLPLKIFAGHVRALVGRCDYILVPRFKKTGWNEEYCVRFWGLPDLVRNTFEEAPLLSYHLDSEWSGAEAAQFIKIGRALQKGPAESLRAYRAGRSAQQAHDRREAERQRMSFNLPGPKILVAAQPYLIHDPLIGATIQRLIAAQGGVPIYSDRCDRAKCRALSQAWSDGLYWTLNQEIIGSILLQKNRVDGVVLLTAFPCGTDSLTNELVVRKIKDVPLIQILLDEHQAQAGLETRIESFMDILRQRRDPCGRA